MLKNLYVTTTEARSGKSVISLGIMDLLLRDIDKVGFFRPIVRKGGEGNDKDINLIKEHCKLDFDYEEMYGCTLEEAQQLHWSGRENDLIDTILKKYKQLENKCDFVLCEGTDFESVATTFEFNVNSEIASNLNAPVFVVLNANNKSKKEIISSLNTNIESFKKADCTILGVVANRTNTDHVEKLRETTQELFKEFPVYVVPEQTILGKATVKGIAQALDADVYCGQENMEQIVNHVSVGAKQIHNFVGDIKQGDLIVTPGDRSDILLGSLLSLIANSKIPTIAGIVLTNGMKPEESVMNIITSLGDKTIPVMGVDSSTFDVATLLNNMNNGLNADDTQKIPAALGLFEAHIDASELREQMNLIRSTRVTPKMFEHRLIEAAKKNIQRIVLPEGTEERILRATEILNRREICKVILLGNETKIKDKISTLGLNMNFDTIQIIDPAKSEMFDSYVAKYVELRKHKGMTEAAARDMMADVNCFGTMMIGQGDADGMVSGSVHTTAQTIRPAFEIIKTKPGCTSVSSVFLMCLADRVLVYGDCAVIPNPTPQQLAEIAINSAETAMAFDIDAKVAMLSYSTGASGTGDDVEAVREGATIAKEARPDLLIEGPIQYDAAIDPNVAKTKLPDSNVAGQATVFVFPDLNTGNNTYKAVQRSANAVAIGPILQGLNAPVNDLSRGCTVIDIVNTSIITAVQAQF